MNNNLDTRSQTGAPRWETANTVQLFCGILAVVIAYQIVHIDTMSLLKAWAIAIALPVSLAIPVNIGRAYSLAKSFARAAYFGALAAVLFWLAARLEWIAPLIGFGDPLTFRFVFEAVILAVIGDICINYDLRALWYARSADIG
jgi:hypothetical protein